MPSWHDISERERFAVIQYIKTFSDRWEKEKIDRPIAVLPEPTITEASIENGKNLFHSKAICFMCHGPAGKGDGPLAVGLKDIRGHPVRPANLTLPAGVHGGVKLGHDGEHIFKTIMTGVGGTPMPAFEGQLTPQEVWDVVHYVQSLRVQAHASELIAAGLKVEDLEEAISRIWASVSQAAASGQLDKEVIRKELAELPMEEMRVVQDQVFEEGKGKSVPESPHEEVYLYPDSGILEKHGVIPLWLKLLCYGLIIWGVYYTIKYWSSE
jgi:mono/diheme cytochrome c family protein